MRTDDVIALLVCPRCKGALAQRDDHIACQDCGRAFASVDGIPLLLVDPHEELRQWSYQLHELAQELDESHDRILAQLAGERLLPRSRGRLERLLTCLPAHKDRVLALFEAIGVAPLARAKKDRDRVPGEGTITAYYHQVFRDWGWHDAAHSDEIGAAMDALASVIPSDHAFGRTLVFGAGPARLVVEIAKRWSTGPIIALDLNPLPYLVAQRVLRGERVALFELPMQPRSSTDVLVDRTLYAPGPVPPGITLVFADGLDPPIADATFDTVITPWFIDQVPPDMREFVAVVRRVLEDGGVWINHGPCIYHPNHTRLAHRYRSDEVLEIVQAAGFEIAAHDRRSVPYMASPASDQGRTEFVLSFFAKKGAADDEPRADPPWLTDVQASVPILPGLAEYVAPHPMFAAVIALVDGERSIAAIAEQMIARHGLPPAAATIGVQGCLREIVRALGSHRLID